MKDIYGNNYDVEKIGERIRRVRKARGMKRLELAEKMYLLMESISRI